MLYVLRFFFLAFFILFLLLFMSIICWLCFCRYCLMMWLVLLVFIMRIFFELLSVIFSILVIKWAVVVLISIVFSMIINISGIKNLVFFIGGFFDVSVRLKSEVILVVIIFCGLIQEINSFFWKFRFEWCVFRNMFMGCRIRVMERKRFSVCQLLMMIWILLMLISVASMMNKIEISSMFSDFLNDNIFLSQGIFILFSIMFIMIIESSLDLWASILENIKISSIIVRVNILRRQWGIRFWMMN